MGTTTWFANGGVSAYDSASETLQQEKILLTTGGAADANAITRSQYSTSPYDGNIRAVGRIRVDYDDWFYARTADPLNGITAIMAVVPASAFSGGLSYIPTIFEIWWGAASYGLIFQANEWTNPPPPVSGYRDMTFHIDGPVPAVHLQANTKYWTAVIPVVSKPGTGSYSPLHSYSNSQGRGISFWTNRTPTAPVIVSPASNLTVAANSVVNLTLTKTDADAISGDTESPWTDMSGVHVQYAARPTAANPSPPWIDMPFADWGGTLRNKGWWIQGSSANLSGDGAATLAVSPTVQVRCGGTPSAGQGALPAGSWQVRVRAFDYGHPYPAALNPINDSSGAYTASTFPAVNTSPWSTAITITIMDQVPPPVPLSPIEYAAVTEGSAVTLSWQYKNTANPPYPQARRTIGIRKVGDVSWTMLANDEVSASASKVVTGFALVSGNQYEWYVSVKDSTLTSSQASGIARFWVVPAPGSGEVRPPPSSTIDGATLGCGTHRVFVYRRGGLERTGELRGVSSVEWNRVRDDISVAQVTISNWDIDCGNLLANLQTWAYELVIMRDNGYSQERVWEGPITLLTYKADSVTIQAKDVMAYAYRRIIKQRMSDSANGDTVTSRAARVLQNTLASDDPNVLAYLTVLVRSDDAVQYRNTPAYSRTAFEEIDDMAANAGLDYTAVGRAILLWGTKHRIGTLPEFRDADLGNSPIVSEYGMSAANLYSVSDGNGIHGEATRLDASGEDPTYGPIEMLSSSWASDSAPESGTYTQEGLQKVQQSFEEFAERSISDRYPPPVVVRVPDNTTLNPDTVITIQQLVPGVVIPLRSTSTLRTIVQSQKLDAVKVIERDGKETISVTMSPFSRDDNDAGGGEEG